MIAGLAILLLIVGALIAAWIAARFRGLRRVAILLLLFAAPFVVLTLVLASATDPTLTAARASYNFWLGFGLISIVMVVPWSLAVLIGSVVGGRRVRQQTVAVQLPSQPAMLPRQWASGDITLLNAEALNRDIAALAERGGVGLDRVPHVGPPTDSGSAHVEIDLQERSYHLIVTERGQELSRRSTDIVDRLLYWIADEMTYILATHPPRSDAERAMEYPAMLRTRQSALMLKIFPGWHAGWLADPETMGWRFSTQGSLP